MYLKQKFSISAMFEPLSVTKAKAERKAAPISLTLKQEITEWCRQNFPFVASIIVPLDSPGLLGFEVAVGGEENECHRARRSRQNHVR